MSLVTNDNIISAPVLRTRMEKAVEQLLAALDALEAADEDLEEVDHGGGAVEDEPHDAGDDDEPSIAGHAIHETQSQVFWAAGNTDDREGDEHDGTGPDVDDEPSLGSFDRVVNQNHAWTRRLGPSTWHAAVDAEADDCDREDCDPAGDIADSEPSLGWPERFSVEGGSVGAFHDGEQA